MGHKEMCDSFVTDLRIADAIRKADALASADPSLANHECAGAAVRQVLGQWMADPDGAFRAERLALLFRLRNRVEGQMGLHRGLHACGRKTLPPEGVVIADSVLEGPDAFVGTTAIAI